MFLHIGENIIIPRKDIVVIIDREAAEKTKSTRELINNMIKKGYLHNNNIDNAKSYILTCAKDMDKKKEGHIKRYNLYASRISSTTLSKRNGNIETGLEGK